MTPYRDNRCALHRDDKRQLPEHHAMAVKSLRDSCRSDLLLALLITGPAVILLHEPPGVAPAQPIYLAAPTACVCLILSNILSAFLASRRATRLYQAVSLDELAKEERRCPTETATGAISAARVVTASANTTTFGPSDHMPSNVSVKRCGSEMMIQVDGSTNDGEPCSVRCMLPKEASGSTTRELASQAAKLNERVSSMVSRCEARIDEQVKHLLHRFGPCSRWSLTARIEELYDDGRCDPKRVAQALARLRARGCADYNAQTQIWEAVNENS